MKRTISLLTGLILSGSTYATLSQAANCNGYIISISIPKVALLNFESSGSQVNLGPTPSTEVRAQLDFSHSVINSLLLASTSISLLHTFFVIRPVLCANQQRTSLDLIAIVMPVKESGYPQNTKNTL